nr:DUF4903 family protein [Prevotella sp.]
MILNSKKNLFLFAVALAILCCTTFFSCTTDEDLSQKTVSDEYISAARKILQDSIVVNATAMQGTVNKTLLDTGCPLKYYLNWKSATSDTLNIQLKNFSVGKMPVTIWFSINCKFMQLNTWEKQEYTEAGWIKFQGTGGTTKYDGNKSDEEGSYESGTGGAGSVTGYFNALTNEIEFVTNFNVMNMSCDVYRQKIDPSRMSNYEADFAQYEKDLAEYKKEHGL